MRLMHPANWATRKLQQLRELAQTDKPYRFEVSCVQATEEALKAMTETAHESSYEEMAAACDLATFEKVMGYTPDTIQLRTDPYVAYFTSHYEGRPCFFLTHSSIEYIYTLKPLEVADGDSDLQIR